MDREAFRELLLQVMDRKDHWAWPAFTSGLVPKNRLHIHLEQEYATYVRDFPVMVGWAYVQCPIAEIRRSLAENLYEEETGGLVAGRPHPELFLEYARGLGMDLNRFDNVELLPGARRYRAFLEEAGQRRGWEIATAVVTIFVEGSQHERTLFDSSAAMSSTEPLDRHPLVRNYGLPVENLALSKAHREVEGDHRDAAWSVILEFVPEEKRETVIRAMEEALALWQGYRDDVAAACGITRGPDRRPRLTFK